MIKAFTKRTLRFNHYESRGGRKVASEYVKTPVLDFCDLPDWVVNDPLFALAKKSGELRIIEAVTVPVAADVSIGEETGTAEQAVAVTTNEEANEGTEPSSTGGPTEAADHQANVTDTAETANGTETVNTAAEENKTEDSNASAVADATAAAKSGKKKKG